MKRSALDVLFGRRHGPLTAPARATAEAIGPIPVPAPTQSTPYSAGAACVETVRQHFDLYDREGVVLRPQHPGLAQAITETKRKQAENCEWLVRERAYYLWIDAGCPEGRADEFWFAAEDQLRQMLRDATNVGKLLAQS